MPQNSIKHVCITKVKDVEIIETADALAIEEPLEIRLEYGTDENRKVQNISVTMRTPGNDKELALGFLFTEGIIKSRADITGVDHTFIACAENKENVVIVRLNAGLAPNLGNMERNFYTTSSCGVCGKGSISAIRTVSPFMNRVQDEFKITPDILHKLPEALHEQQVVFADTGGLHASALFSNQGELLMVREDVGRHNALDKLIGAALLEDKLPLSDSVLLLSGRASFELIQKAAMAGIRVIAAVGAPSSLAVELANEFDITLAGFLRNQRFNIYSATRRISLPVHENTY